MNKLTIDDLLKAVDYQSYSLVEGLGQEIESVEFDSRKIIAKSLFVPLVGGSRDGHEYVQMAIENGANVVFGFTVLRSGGRRQCAVLYMLRTRRNDISRLLRERQDKEVFLRRNVDHFWSLAARIGKFKLTLCIFSEGEFTLFAIS